MEKIKGITTCNVCGRDFPLISEEHYVARNKDREGGQIGSIIAGKEEPTIFDAFDCPHCGCQNIMQERKRHNIEINFGYGECNCCEDDLK